MNEKIVEIRRSKVECDWGKWKTVEDRMACEIKVNCVGCGAFKPTATIQIPVEAETVIFQLQNELYEVNVHTLLKFLRALKKRGG